MTNQVFNLHSYLEDESHGGRYLLNSAGEIRALLNHMQRKHIHVTGHLDNGHDIFSTSILAVEKTHLIMDRIPDEALSKRILACSQLLFSAFHNGVPVRFISSLIASCSFEESLAFTIPVPTEVLWRQRREYFRVPVPSNQPPLCEIDLKTGQIARNPLSDISVGGLGMLVPAASMTLSQGTVLGDCHIDLPGFGSLRSDIHICNESMIELRSGHEVKRYGCQFVNLPQREQSLLQRYVIKLESDMHAGFPGV